ncbi:MFS transporter [Robbsia sp. KACC 23696]|uniref:MFS transporter n=1 Tax=Robbsia sp. KACC 23696 TaxID=3149231 RepID=UPI00325A9A24
MDSLSSSQRNWVMSCLLLGTILSSLDSAIANIALPIISRSLQTSDSAVVLVVNAYQVAVTVCLLPVAALAESFGLKRLYASGLVIFTLASLACALSPTLAILVSARAMQGVGGACMAVTSMAMIRSIYPPQLLGRGFALMALAIAVSGAIGPTVAAAILSIASWHWLFLINVPLGAIAAPVFLALAPAGVRQKRAFDFIGTLLNAFAFGLIIVGVDTLGNGHTPLAIGEMIAGLACLGLLVRQQMHRTAPLLPLDLVRIPVFALSMGTSICSYAAQVLAYASLPFYFERTLHLSAVQTGLLLTPWPILVAVTAPIGGRLMVRYAAAKLSSIGLAVMAAGLFLLGCLPTDPSHLDIVWRMALCGIGFGLFQTPNNTTLMTAGPPTRSGAASGMAAVARYVGWSFGSAVVALIFSFGGSSPTIACLITGAVFSVSGAVFSTARWRLQTTR